MLEWDHSDPDTGVQSQTAHWGECPCCGDTLEGWRNSAWGVQPLHPRLHVLHMYTKLKMSSSKVSVVVKNMSESAIFLKMGMQVVRVVSVSPVLPTELSLEMKAVLGIEDK